MWPPITTSFGTLRLVMEPPTQSRSKPSSARPRRMRTWVIVAAVSVLALAAVSVLAVWATLKARDVTLGPPDPAKVPPECRISDELWERIGSPRWMGSDVLEGKLVRRVNCSWVPRQSSEVRTYLDVEVVGHVPPGGASEASNAFEVKMERFEPLGSIGDEAGIARSPDGRAVKLVARTGPTIVTVGLRGPANVQLAREARSAIVEIVENAN